MIKMKYTYYTDGAATMVKKNGKYLREAGGWAFIKLENNKIISEQSGGCPLTTNNEMELYAIYASVRDFNDTSNENDEIEICSDSSYCINIFTQWASGWKRRGWRKSDGKTIENLELIKAIWDLIQPINIQFRKVKGHSKDKLNQKADKLAVSAKINSKKTGKTIGYNQKEDSLLGNKSSLNN